jgi:uncharacterized protein (DUF4415 family)
MKLTKNDMARVIVQALYNLDKLPARDNVHVKRRERMKKDELRGHYAKAHGILTKRVAAKSDAVKAEIESKVGAWRCSCGRLNSCARSECAKCSRPKSMAIAKPETFKSGRGGARPGAGRPEAENPKIRVSYRLAPDVVEWIRAQPGGPTKAIETAVRAMDIEKELKTIIDAKQGSKELAVFYFDNPDEWTVAIGNESASVQLGEVPGEIETKAPTLSEAVRKMLKAVEQLTSDIAQK